VAGCSDHTSSQPSRPGESDEFGLDCKYLDASGAPAANQECPRLVRVMRWRKLDQVSSALPVRKRVRLSSVAALRSPTGRCSGRRRIGGQIPFGLARGPALRRLTQEDGGPIRGLISIRQCYAQGLSIGSQMAKQLACAPMMKTRIAPDSGVALRDLC
jgi:hypothetical protein